MGKVKYYFVYPKFLILFFGILGERNSAKVYSKFYRAPELFSDSQYHLSIDVWATGCIIGEMTLGRKAFNEAKEQGTEKVSKQKKNKG